MPMHPQTKVSNSLIAAALVGAAACVPVETTLSSEDKEARLYAAAQTLAPLLDDTGLRAELRLRLERRSTGDFEVLLQDLVDLELRDGRLLGEVLQPTGVLELRAAHIASPGGIPESFDEGEVRVAWAPLGDEATTVDLFDSSGAVESVSAAERPDGPLLVIGLNERVSLDEAGDEQLATQTQGVQSSSCNGWSCTTSSCRDVEIRKIQIYDDKEPWYKGDPEIYMMCVIPGSDLSGMYVNCGSVDMPGVNDENHWYWINKVLINGLRSGYPLECHVLERDSGIDHPTDSDDSLGSTIVRYEDGTKTYACGSGAFNDASFELGTYTPPDTTTSTQPKLNKWCLSDSDCVSGFCIDHVCMYY